MNQLYNQVSGHIVGYIGFLTNNMANYLIAVLGYTISLGSPLLIFPSSCRFSMKDLLSRIVFGKLAGDKGSVSTSSAMTAGGGGDGDGGPDAAATAA